jgi:putative oxidoreductase
MKKNSIALLVLRIAVGIVFIAHGWQKIYNPAAFESFFASQHLPMFFVYLVGYVEFIGGICVLLGLFSCVAAAALGVIMLVALFYVKGGAVFRTFNVPVFETDLVLLASLIVLALKGSGRYALYSCDKANCCKMHDSCDCGEHVCEIKS